MNQSSINTTEAQLLADALVKHMLAHSRSLLLFFDDAGTIILASRSIENLVGHSLVGADIKDVLLDFNDTLDSIRKCDVFKDGQLLHISTFDRGPLSFIFRGYTSPGRCILIGEEDYAELERSRAGLSSLNLEMHDMSRELYRKNARLQQLSVEKNQLLGMAAHDLRNPLSAIVAFAQILKMDTNNPLHAQHAEMVDAIIESSSIMLSIVEDTLNLTALESGKMELRLTNIDVSELFHRCLASNSLLAEKKRIAIIESVTGTNPIVLCDTAKITQVLDNLVSNAIKFSGPDSSVNVNLRLEPDSYVITVRDEGSGIPLREQKTIFIPFHKGSVQPTGGESSTGLGLSIIKRIVEGHGGSIALESTVGVGSTFTITLPRIANEARL